MKKYQVYISECWDYGNWSGTISITDYVIGSKSAQEAVGKAVEFAKKQCILNPVVTKVSKFIG